MDLFVSWRNCHLLRLSTRLDPLTWQTNVFPFEWEEREAYAFLPYMKFSGNFVSHLLSLMAPLA